MMKSLKKPEFIKSLGISAAEVIKGLGIAGFLAFFFYRSFWAVIPMTVPAAVLIWWDRKQETRRQDKELLQQFEECVLAVAGAVKAGYAAENAFVESMKDMEMMFGAESNILQELVLIKGGLHNHLPLEQLLYEMGCRTGLKEIQEFGEIFAITKRNGGSLVEIIHMTAEEIHTGRILEEEVNTLLSSKKLEQRIMNLMPFLLVLYLQATTPGYFDLFFKDMWGSLLMTVFLVWYMAAYCFSEYILWKAVG